MVLSISVCLPAHDALGDVVYIVGGFLNVLVYHLHVHTIVKLLWPFKNEIQGLGVDDNSVFFENKVVHMCTVHTYVGTILALPGLIPMTNRMCANVPLPQEIWSILFIFT